jgi:hypothetical protein
VDHCIATSNASDRCENFRVWWADKDEGHDGGFSEKEYRMKAMDGGMLLFQAKEGGGFIAVAPHTWRRIKTGTVDPTE